MPSHLIQVRQLWTHENNSARLISISMYLWLHLSDSELYLNIWLYSLILFAPGVLPHFPLIATRGINNVLKLNRSMKRKGVERRGMAGGQAQASTHTAHRRWQCGSETTWKPHHPLSLALYSIFASSAIKNSCVMWPCPLSSLLSSHLQQAFFQMQLSEITRLLGPVPREGSPF